MAAPVEQGGEHITYKVVVFLAATFVDMALTCKEVHCIEKNASIFISTSAHLTGTGARERQHRRPPRWRLPQSCRPDWRVWSSAGGE